MAAAEMAPFAKAGGLGDVLCALSRVLGAAGHEVRVVLPCYGSIDRDAFGLQPVASLEIPMGSLGRIAVTVLQGRTPRSPVHPYFIAYDPYYVRRGISGHDGDGFTDNDLRYTLLSRAALELPGTWAGGRMWFTYTTGTRPRSPCSSTPCTATTRRCLQPQAS